MAEDCCNTRRYGLSGNPSCWDGMFTFERCCPGTAGEAGSLLEEIEQHHVAMLRELHEALLAVSTRRTGRSLHPATYLPFFPYLLMALHQRTGKADYLHCIARTAATLAVIVVVGKDGMLF
ncbi:hypothetical protein AK812_SmicGene18756 [Symbiodinium microadriaticum]|uniref:Uncharacterized protein n=1 Tax=Symbiodinium microadriaticum TaxID=2951 RepID=A0A1Q9DUB7_SYMMI|nr:hypothetical protein AK812_SmicGene18756 [Symbiodinium microadriaticum]